MINQYNKMWQAYNNGYITVQEWTEYCDLCLLQLLYQNREMLQRMKYM